VGIVALVFGLIVLIFIRMIEPKNIKDRRLELERAEEMGQETRLPGTATTITDE
jgi:hypothetical protein